MPAKSRSGVGVVLLDGVDRAALRQVAGDRGPGAAAVGALQQVGLEVAPLVVVEGGEHGVGVGARGDQVADVGRAPARRGSSRCARQVPPPSSRDLDQAVVGAGVEQPLDERRLVERDERAVERGRGVLGHRVDAPHAAHHRQLVAVDVAGEVRRHRLPGVAAVVAAEQALGAEVEAGRRVRREEQRRRPVPAQRRLARLRLRLDVEDLAAPAVVADQAAVLRLRVDDVRVGRVRLALKPSPPTVTNQSPLMMPWPLTVRDGPPSVLLSWVPP